jgi:carbamate kinase
MRVVVALGGNALQRRGEPMTVESQRLNVRKACEALAPVALEHELVISHGNGPQVGLLALQAAAYGDTESYPFDVLGAQTEGMIGYFIEQELGNLLPFDKPLATVLTMTEVDPDDPAFDNPSKFVGPVYTEQEALARAADKGWTVKPDGNRWRRVVPSPLPRRIFEIRPIKWLLEQGSIVVCTGGGGIPTMYRPGTSQLVGVEAVIDKDRSSAVLAHDVGADRLVIVTDATGVFVDYGTARQRQIDTGHPDAVEALSFPPGSMGPKVEAACAFARRSGKEAAIGALDDLPAILAGRAGTRISTSYVGISFTGS